MPRLPIKPQRIRTMRDTGLALMVSGILVGLIIEFFMDMLLAWFVVPGAADEGFLVEVGV